MEIPAVNHPARSPESATSASGRAERDPRHAVFACRSQKQSLRRPAQCRLIMPATGQRCGSPARRGELFCCHHARNHRELSRERVLCERLDRLSARLDSMDTAALLLFLQQELAGMRKTIRRFPEAAHTLVYTLDRLNEITSLESILRAFLKQNDELAATATATSAPSETWSQATQNQ